MDRAEPRAAHRLEPHGVSGARRSLPPRRAVITKDAFSARGLKSRATKNAKATARPRRSSKSGGVALTRCLFDSQARTRSILPERAGVAHRPASARLPPAPPPPPAV